ncbi:glycine betaine ABC transporter substrate-binding protein [Arthrobacter psychrolactophilus]
MSRSFMHRKNGHSKAVAAVAVAVLLLGTATACTPEPIVSIPSASQAPGVTVLKIGTPQMPDGVDPSAGALLAQVYAASLAAAGVEASVAPTPAAKGALFSALEQGAVDVVPVYSRVALLEASATATGKTETPGEVLDALRTALPETLTLLDPLKAEEQGSIVVTAVTAQKYQLKSLSDVGKICDKLAMGGSAGFKTAANGLAGLGSDYNCIPKKYESLQPTLEYGDESILWALIRDEVQLAEIHASSPAIADNSLVILSDPKDLFPNQNIVPLVATQKVTAALQDVINKVSVALTDEELSNLTRLSQDGHYATMNEAALAWLTQKGLVKASS